MKTKNDLVIFCTLITVLSGCTSVNEAMPIDSTWGGHASVYEASLSLPTGAFMISGGNITRVTTGCTDLDKLGQCRPEEKPRGFGWMNETPTRSQMLPRWPV